MGDMKRTATITALFLKPASGQPMRPSRELVLIPNQGIEGDHSFGRTTRQVLLVDQGVLADFGLEAGDLRENVTVEGLEVNALNPGSRLQIGAARLEVYGDCSPCSKLEELQPGLQEAIRGRRGILATVLQGETIRIGDPVITLDNE
jgi:hypothetical protein